MLTYQEYNELARLRNELAHNPRPGYSKLLRYLLLIQKEGAKGQQEVQQLMINTNSNSIEQLARTLSTGVDTDKLIQGLLFAGLGILIGWALLEAMKK